MQRQRESQVFTIADAEEETTASETANSAKVKKVDETVTIENPQKNDTSSPQSLQQKVENATGVIDVLPTEIKEEWYSMHFAGAGLPEPDTEK